jgi:hypothetical protein
LPYDGRDWNKFQADNKGISKPQQQALFRGQLQPEDVQKRLCSRANCTRPHKALGMCHKHYKSIAVKVRVCVLIQSVLNL